MKREKRTSKSTTFNRDPDQIPSSSCKAAVVVFFIVLFFVLQNHGFSSVRRTCDCTMDLRVDCDSLSKREI